MKNNNSVRLERVANRKYESNWVDGKMAAIIFGCGPFGRLYVLDEQGWSNPYLQCDFAVDEIESNLSRDGYSMSDVRSFKCNSRIYNHLFFYLNLRKDGTEELIVSALVEALIAENVA